MLKSVLFCAFTLLAHSAVAAEITVCHALDQTVLITSPGVYLETPGRLRVRDVGFFGGTFLDEEAEIVQADRGGEDLLVAGSRVARFYNENFASWSEFDKASVEILKTARATGLIHWTGSKLTILIEVPDQNLYLRFRDDWNDDREDMCSFNRALGWL